MTVTLIRAADRYFWNNEWLTSRQSFPGTGNFDIYAGAHGVLAMHNDDEVIAGDGLEPAHSTRDFTDALAAGEPLVVASGRPEHADTQALPIANRFAAFHVARPRAGQTVRLPGAPFGHVYAIRGTVRVETAELPEAILSEGDALRLTDGGAVTLTASTDAEIGYWEMHASFDVARPA